MSLWICSALSVGSISLQVYGLYSVCHVPSSTGVFCTILIRQMLLFVLQIMSCVQPIFYGFLFVQYPYLLVPQMLIVPLSNVEHLSFFLHLRFVKFRLILSSILSRFDISNQIYLLFILLSQFHPNKDDKSLIA